MSVEVTVIIRPDGTTEVRGEGFETKTLKKDLEGLGKVTERHEGHSHARITTEQTQEQKA